MLGTIVFEQIEATEYYLMPKGIVEFMHQYEPK